MEKVSIIGLGNVGGATFIEINKKIKCYGVDINDFILKGFQKQGYEVGKEIKKSEVYIIAVYTTDQIFDILNKIDFNENPLIIIESTLDISRIDELENFFHDKNCNGLVIFPHRFNPNDPEHHVFNLDRVIGAYNNEALNKALTFYRQFMDEKLIHVVDPRIAVLSKIVENSYRFVEIAIAEGLKMSCDKLGIDFNKLRGSVNTKWNIDIKEARDGIKGSCLPKDTKFLVKYFKDNEILRKALEVDEAYRKDII